MKNHPNSSYIRKRTRQYGRINGLSPSVLEDQSIDSLSKSDVIKFIKRTPLYIKGEVVDNFFVYAFLSKYGNKIMYSKYALNPTSKDVVFLSWHPSLRPNDGRFKILK